MSQAAKINSARTMGAGATLSGGVLGGVLDAKLGDGQTYEIANIPVAAVGGLLVGMLGLSDIVPGAEYVAAGGFGMAAYGAGVYTRDKMAG